MFNFSSKHENQELKATSTPTTINVQCSDCMINLTGSFRSSLKHGVMNYMDVHFSLSAPRCYCWDQLFLQLAHWLVNSGGHNPKFQPCSTMATSWRLQRSKYLSYPHLKGSGVVCEAWNLAMGELAFIYSTIVANASDVHSSISGSSTTAVTTLNSTTVIWLQGWMTKVGEIERSSLTIFPDQPLLWALGTVVWRKDCNYIQPSLEHWFLGKSIAKPPPSRWWFSSPYLNGSKVESIPDLFTQAQHRQPDPSTLPQ